MKTTTKLHGALASTALHADALTTDALTTDALTTHGAHAKAETRNMYTIYRNFYNFPYDAIKPLLKKAMDEARPPKGGVWEQLDAVSSTVRTFDEACSCAISRTNWNARV